MRRQASDNKIVIGFISVWFVFMLLNLALLGGIAYVIIHFVVKFW